MAAIRARWSSRILRTAVAALAALAAGGSCGSTTPLPPITLFTLADAYVCSGDLAGINFGLEPSSFRGVGRQDIATGEQIGRQFYRFVRPVLWSPKAVASAVLHLQVRGVFAGVTPIETAVYGVDDLWGETSVTWSSQPFQETGILDSVSAVCCGGEYTFDVTGYVNAQIALGDRTFCFSLRAPDEGIIGGLTWFMREGDGFPGNGFVGTWPTLVLTPP